MTFFHDHYRVESTRLPDWDYSARGWYFVTICTRRKKCTLGEVIKGRTVLYRAGAMAEREMRAIPDHYTNVTVDRFVIMPNHVHAIIVIEGRHAYSPVETRLAASPAPCMAYRWDRRRGKPRLCRTASHVRKCVVGYKAGVTKICPA